MVKHWIGAACVALVLITMGCVVAAPPPPAVVSAVPPPPPPQSEVIIVQPSPAHVWVPGHWAWRAPRRAYVWVPGHWVVPAGPRHVWVPGHGRATRRHVWVKATGEVTKWGPARTPQPPDARTAPGYTGRPRKYRNMLRC